MSVTGRGRTWALATLALVVWGLPGIAFAGEVTIEGFGGIGSGPKIGTLEFEKKFGGGGGIGWMVGKNFQLRADAASYKWTAQRSFSTIGICFITGPFRFCIPGTRGTDTLDLKNTPVFVGGRYFLTAPEKKVRPFLEFGLGIEPVELTSSRRSTNPDKQTKTGAVPGAGLELKLAKAIGIGVGARYHAIGKGVGDEEDVEPGFFTVSGMLILHL